MEIQLDHSKSEKQGDVPVFTPALGVDALHEYARKNKEELENLGKRKRIDAFVYVVTPKCVPCQTVKSQMKCRQIRHFIGVYNVC